MTLTRESRAAMPAARDWLAGFYGTRHALSARDVIEDIHKHYPGGWDRFVTDWVPSSRGPA